MLYSDISSVTQRTDTAKGLQNLTSLAQCGS